MTSFALFFPEHTLSGFVFSDPWYDQDVSCQFRRHALPYGPYDVGRAVFVDVDTRVEEHEGISYPEVVANIAVVRQTQLSNIFGIAARRNEFGELHFGSTPLLKEQQRIDIGVDTAHLFIGSMSMFNTLGQEASIATGSDGYFGTVSSWYATTEAWEAHCEKHGRQKTKLPLGGKTSWCGTTGVFGFDSDMISEPQLVNHLRMTFNDKGKAVEVPMSVGDDWVSLSKIWERVPRNG